MIDLEFNKEYPVVFLACCSTKQTVTCCACEMYIGSLFKKSFEYANQITDMSHIYILSAKYGLLHPTDVIEPYNLTLNNMSKQERLTWSNKIIKQIQDTTDIQKDTEIIFLTGIHYREFLQQYFTNWSCPTTGLGIGSQLQWYNEKLSSKSHKNDLW